MSKIGNFNLELQSQANELGFESLQEAIENGYTIDYTEQKLKSLDELQDIAHKEWLKEKEIVLGDLKTLLIHNAFDFDIIKHAIEFIEQGEH